MIKKTKRFDYMKKRIHFNKTHIRRQDHKNDYLMMTLSIFFNK